MSPPRACRSPGSRFAGVRPDSRILGPSGISPSAQRSGSGGASRRGMTARPRALKIPPRTSPGRWPSFWAGFHRGCDPAQKTSTSHVARPTTITAVMMSNPAREVPLKACLRSSAAPPLPARAQSTRHRPPLPRPPERLGKPVAAEGRSVLPFRAAGPVPGRVRGGRGRAAQPGQHWRRLLRWFAAGPGVQIRCRQPTAAQGVQGGPRPPRRPRRCPGRSRWPCSPAVALLPITVAR